MKKFLLILICLFPITGYAFNNNMQFPQAQFASINQTKFHTYYKPNITPVGATNAYNYENSNISYNSPRRVKDNPGEPYQTPIGDTPVIFMICLIGIYITIVKWKRIQSLPF